MSNPERCFEVLIDQSKNLRNRLREEAELLCPDDRAIVTFELRLAYNLTVRRCRNEVISRELLKIIAECEDLLNA